MLFNPTHMELSLRAEKWLNQQSCKVVVREPFQCPSNREQPDAIGWRADASILIEVKVSRSDFLKDKKKVFRNDGTGMGDWRFYMSPPNIIRPEDLPEGWGLLWVTPKTVKKVHGCPPNTRWYRDKPFTGNKINENHLLVSALRRFFVRNLHENIYIPYGQVVSSNEDVLTKDFNFAKICDN